jgi:hypothetical protein
MRLIVIGKLSMHCVNRAVGIAITVVSSALLFCFPQLLQASSLVSTTNILEGDSAHGGQVS